MSDIVQRNHPQELIPYSDRSTDHFRSDGTDDRFEIQLFVRRLMKRKYQILAIMLGVMIPTAIFTFLTTPLYRSTAQIKIIPNPVEVLSFKEIPNPASLSPHYDMYMKTEEQILNGSGLKDRVARRLNSESESEKMRAEIPYLWDRFGVSRIENTQLLLLSYLATDPQVAADVVNIFAEEYIAGISESNREIDDRAKDTLEEIREEVNKKVETSERELARYVRQHGITPTEPGQVDLVEKKLGDLDNQLTTLEGELASAKSRVETLEKASADDFPAQYMTDSLSSLFTQILQLENQLADLQTTYGDNWPAVIQTRARLEQAREQLKREKASALAQALDQAKMDLRSVEKRRELISNSKEDQEKIVNQNRDASIDYDILRRNVETYRKLYGGVLEDLGQTNLTAGTEFGNVMVTERGGVSNTPDSPKIVWNLALSVLAGLALGFCFALAMDFWDNSISTPEEAERLVNLPVLGFIPRAKPAKEKMAITSRGNGNGSRPAKALSVRSDQVGSDPMRNNQSRELAENIRSICASILLSRSDKPPRIIMVTSATPSEGKTSLVEHLGRAFAESGNSTLMVETDMRKPSLSGRFGYDQKAGLSLFLSGVARRLPEIHTTPSPNLFVISAGPKAPNPVALFYSTKMDEFLKEIPSSYRFIILDAPPVLAVADPQVLCPKVDGVILVVRAGRTARNLVDKSRKLLEASGGNILGIVLNDMTVSRSGYGYYRQYYQ